MRWSSVEFAVKAAARVQLLQIRCFCRCKGVRAMLSSRRACLKGCKVADPEGPLGFAELDEVGCVVNAVVEEGGITLLAAVKAGKCWLTCRSQCCWRRPADIWSNLVSSSC